MTKRMYEMYFDSEFIIERRESDRNESEIKSENES